MEEERLTIDGRIFTFRDGIYKPADVISEERKRTSQGRIRKTAGILLTTLLFGCASPEEKALDQVFKRDGKEAATAPAEAPEKAEPEKKTDTKLDIPQVSDAIIGRDYRGFLAATGAFEERNDTQQQQFGAWGVYRLIVPGTTNVLGEVKGKVAYAIADHDAGMQDQLDTSIRGSIGYLFFNEGEARKGKLFNNRAIAVQVFGGYDALNLDNAFMKNGKSPYAGGGLLWLDGPFQASLEGTHLAGATQEAKFGLHGDVHGWSMSADAAYDIESTGTIFVAHADLNRTVSDLKTRVNDQWTEFRTKGKGYTGRGAVLQRIPYTSGRVIAGPFGEYGDQQSDHTDNLDQTLEEDRTTTTKVGGMLVFKLGRLSAVGSAYGDVRHPGDKGVAIQLGVELP